MRRNVGRPSVPGTVVDRLVSTVTARLAARHPALGESLVDSVVYQAAAELVGTITDPEQLKRQLDSRAHARLTAMAGAPIPIARRRPS